MLSYKQTPVAVWQRELAGAVRDPVVLVQVLGLEETPPSLPLSGEELRSVAPSSLP